VVAVLVERHLDHRRPAVLAGADEVVHDAPELRLGLIDQAIHAVTRIEEEGDLHGRLPRRGLRLGGRGGAQPGRAERGQPDDDQKALHRNSPWDETGRCTKLHRDPGSADQGCPAAGRSFGAWISTGWPSICSRMSPRREMLPCRPSRARRSARARNSSEPNGITRRGGAPASPLTSRLSTQRSPRLKNARSQTCCTAAVADSVMSAL